MTTNDIAPFVAELLQGGYRPEPKGRLSNDGCDEYWKGFYVDGYEDRQYTVWLRIWDRSTYNWYQPVWDRYSVEYGITLNHETAVDVELFKATILHNTMTIGEWERRCAAIYAAMVANFPKP
jgi:hypothetical protein